MYLQATLQVVWSPRGQTPIVALHPGRESVHFYGALNLATGEETVLRSTIMTAQTSASFLSKLLQTYPDKPILLFWDRAPWHRGAEIEQVCKDNPRLEIVFFPTAAPDLNPQEHVWKATRKAVSHNHQFAKLNTLAQAFETHLESTTFPCSLLDLHGYHQICAMFK